MKTFKSYTTEGLKDTIKDIKDYFKGVKQEPSSIEKRQYAAKKPEKGRMNDQLGEAKDNREYDYEGDMAMSQLKSIITNAQRLHDMLEPSTNLPEWVQSKITLAEDYVLTAANYMEGEMNEEVEQLDERGANKYKRSTESGAGLTRAGVMKHRRENPGSKLSTAVTTPPSKLKKGSKAWNRRKSFCARMSGVKGPMKDEKGRPTRKAMSLRRWNCE